MTIAALGELPQWFSPGMWQRSDAGRGRIAVPSGILCAWCLEAIKPNQHGFRMVDGTVMHRECLVRSVVGGVNHILGVCTCCRGILPPDPQGLTRREAAIEAHGAWERHLELEERRMEREEREATRKKRDA